MDRENSKVKKEGPTTKRITCQRANKIHQIVSLGLIVWMFSSLFVSLFYLFSYRKIDIFSFWGEKIEDIALFLKSKGSICLYELFSIVSYFFGAASQIWYSIFSRFVNMVQIIDGWLIKLGEMLIVIEKKGVPSFDAASTIITTMGISGFALTTINEIRARRHHGVPLRDVIDYFYPHHQTFLFLYIGFFFLGIYSCEAEVALCVVRCFWGVVICACYSFSITWSTSLCNNLNFPIVFRYIDQITHRALCVAPKDLSIEKYNELIADVSSYIGQNYLQSSSRRPYELMQI